MIWQFIFIFATLALLGGLIALAVALVMTKGLR